MFSVYWNFSGQIRYVIFDLPNYFDIAVADMCYVFM